MLGVNASFERRAARAADRASREPGSQGAGTLAAWRSSVTSTTTGIVTAMTDHIHAPVSLIGPAPSAAAGRAAAVRRARWLNAATISWNAVEGVVAVTAGLAAGSVSLIGFGFDSGIEVSAALVLTWRLHQERLAGCRQADDARATRAIAISFAVLGVFVAVESARDLLSGSQPDASAVGMVMAALSLVVMPMLARAKRSLAPVLGSAAAAADAKQTNLCALLSAVLLVGLGANAALGWWWADPTAGLGIAGLALMEARRTWRAESLADTCCV